MSRKRLTKNVIRYLENKEYRFLKTLGKGGFADVISVRNPAGNEVAIKIVAKENVWPTENNYWGNLHHPHILQLYDVIEVQDLKVTLYVMPRLPTTLADVLESKEFKKDSCSFMKIKKWMLQVLSAVDYLHRNGFCHLDIKTDNVFIDEEENAVLADFSGLNFTRHPVERLVSPLVFQPPECFANAANKNIRGKNFDLWSFGLLVLNAVTGHYFHRKAKISTCFMNWHTHLQPILQKALTESKFDKLMRKAFPKSNLSVHDVLLARHFIQFILNIIPEDRPNAMRAKKHFFMKTVSNPFLKDLYETLQEESPDFNPFKLDLDRNCLRTASPKTEAVESSCEPSQDKDTPEKKRTGAQVKKWFLKKVKFFK